MIDNNKYKLLNIIRGWHHIEKQNRRYKYKKSNIK